MPPQASTGNPVDMIASAGGDDYERTLAAVAEDPGVDLAIMRPYPPLEQGSDEVAGDRAGARRIDGRVAMLTCFMSSGDCRRR